jgi:hypothetical protein
MPPSPARLVPAGSLPDASGSCCVDCDLYWSPPYSDEESPPSAKRPASTMYLCHRCGRSPIAQSRYSDLAVCWECDRYLWWLEQSRKAEQFLEEFNASESGHRPNADHHIISVEVVQNDPRHTDSGARCLSRPGGSDCRALARDVCACGLVNAQNCPSKENHHCHDSVPGRQLACATLISEVSHALKTIRQCSKRLKTACAALHSSDFC